MSEFLFLGNVKLLIHICKQPRLPWRGGDCDVGCHFFGGGGSEAAPQAPVLVVGEGHTLCALPCGMGLGSLLQG